MAHNVWSTYLNSDESATWAVRSSSTDTVHSRDIPLSRTHSTVAMLDDVLQPPHPPFANDAFASRSASSLGSTSKNSLSVNYLPSKFSAALLHPTRFRRRKNRDGAAGLGGKSVQIVDEDEDEKGNRGSKTLRWNKFKWILFCTNSLLFAYSMTALIFTLLLWFDFFHRGDIIRVGNRSELILSTFAASFGVFTSVVGWAGILLNNRSFLAVYTFLAWITFALLVIPGYVTYKRFEFNLEGKINQQWSRDLEADGRLRIQNQLGCCGYFSPFVEATISQTCYARSVLPGCKLRYLDFERTVLKRWYLACFLIVPAHIGVILAGLLCSNHVTYRFGKGMTPEPYRLVPSSMAVIVDQTANQLAEQYGPEVASIFISRTRLLSSSAHFAEGLGPADQGASQMRSTVLRRNPAT